MKCKIIKGPFGVGQSYPLNGNAAIVIGRGKDAHIQLEDPGISKRHVQLTVISNNNVEIRDLKSANGTFVNGKLIKAKNIGAGDVIKINNFILKLVPEAPTAALAAPSSTTDNYQNSPPLMPDRLSEDQQFKTVRATSIGEKTEAFLENTIFPWADRMANSFDVRYLLLFCLGLWTIVTAVLVVLPFQDRANNQIYNQSIEVARLYARQLVRLNQDAIIEGRLSDLVVKLDERGQTPGVVEALILDAQKFQILAPRHMLGQPLPNSHANRAVKSKNERVFRDKSGVAFVSAPIRVGTANGDQTAATAFVIFNPKVHQFNLVTVIDDAATSILLSMLIGLGFCLLFYRWYDDSISKVSEKMNHAMASGNDSAVDLRVKWPALQELIRQANFAIAKGSLDLGAGPPSEDNCFKAHSTLSDQSIWAQELCRTLSTLPFIALNLNLELVEFSPPSENLLGANLQEARHQDLSFVLRDLSLEVSIRDACQEAQMIPWKSVNRSAKIQNNEMVVSVIFGHSQFLVMFTSGGALDVVV